MYFKGFISAAKPNECLASAWDTIEREMHKEGLLKCCRVTNADATESPSMRADGCEGTREQSG